MVYDALERDGPQCNIAMIEAIKSVEDLIDDPNKWEQLDGINQYNITVLILAFRNRLVLR